MMTERERLAELILDANAQPPDESWPETLADHLLEHGMIVPPRMVGGIRCITSEGFTVEL